MSLATTLGLRYLRAKRGSRFISLISGFSVLGVAIGVCTLIVVLSVMDGFETILRERLAKGEFHILITPSITQSSLYFSLSPDTLSRIYATSPEIISVNPVLKMEAILRAGKRISGVSIRGITESHMNSIAPLLVEATEQSDKQKILQSTGLWMGKELAYQLNILPGDKVTIISPLETEGPLESVPRIRSFAVEGIYESGIPEKDLHVVYAPVSAVSEFLNIENKVNQIEVQTRSFEDSTPIAESVRELLGGNFIVRDWKDMNAHLFASLRLERITMFLILAMIVLVASFNIVTSLTMLVTEKRKDIAILKAMGASARQIGRVFLVQGAVIGNFGTILGFVTGLSICLFLKKYPVIQLPDVFYDRSLPVKISFLYIGGIVVTAIGIVLAAAWFPARSAAKLSPLEGFREA